MNIKNSTIIVTGASMGIGLATANLLAKEGANVVFAARSKDAIIEAAKAFPNAIAIETDMTDPTQIDNLLSETLKKFGRIDVLVNNAGQGMYGAIENLNIDNYRKIWELNVIGPLVAMQKIIPIMRKQGGGSIINISSLVSKNYFPFLGGYASTKYALNALTLTARAELEKDNIVVSLMHPGLTATEFGKNALKEDTAAQGMTPRTRANMPTPDSAEYIAERIKLTIENGEAEIYAHDERKS